MGPVHSQGALADPGATGDRRDDRRRDGVTGLQELVQEVQFALPTDEVAGDGG